MIYLYYLYIISVFISPNFYYLFTGNADKFIGLSEIMLPFLCFVNCIYIILLKSKNYKIFIEPSTKTIFILLCTIYVIGLLGLITSSSCDLESLSFFFRYSFNLLLFFQLSYIFTYKFLMSKNRYSFIVNKLLSILFIVLIIIVLVNIIELFYPNLIDEIYAYKYLTSIHKRFGIPRLVGTMGTPNTNAIVIYFFISYTFLFIYEKRRTFKKILSIFFLLLLFLILLFTGSRGGLLAFLAQAFVFLNLSLKRFNIKSRMQLYLINCLFILFFLNLFILNLHFRDQILRLIYKIGFSHSEYEKQSLSIFTYTYIPPAILERLYFIFKGINAYLHFSIFKKLFGIGFNVSKNILENLTGLELFSVHNAFVEYLLLTGIIGLFFYLVLIFKTFFYIKKHFFYTKLGKILYFFFIGTIIHSFFESNFMFNFKNMQIFLFLFAIYVAERNLIYNQKIIEKYFAKIIK